jgi:hypothetical protein
MLRPSRVSKFLLLAATAAFAPIAVSLADTVVKKDGTKVEGKIIANDESGVTIETPLGELKIAKADIRAIETGKTSAELFKDKWEEVDRADADALLDLARWCDENKLSREAKKVYREIIDKVDPEHEAARRALGFVKVGDEWKTKAEVDAEKKAAAEAEKKEKAAKAKADKAKADKNKKPAGKSKGPAPDNGLEFPDEIDGFVKAGEDRAEEDGKVKVELEGYFGQKFSAASSRSFQLAVQMPPEEADFHVRVAEKCLYDANMMFDMPESTVAWGGRFMIFHVLQKGTFVDLVDWLDKNVAEIKPETKKFFKDGGGLVTGTSKGPLCAHYETNVPLKNAIPQWIGNIYISGYSRGGAREWLQQGFGMYLAIHEFGVSLMTFVTEKKYENAVELADKNSDSAYKLICHDIIAGRFETKHPWNEIRVKNLNALDYVDLAKCWSMVDFLMTEKREEFKEFLKICGTVEDEEEAMRKALGMDGHALDQAWEQFVLANYDKVPQTGAKPKQKPTK